MSKLSSNELLTNILKALVSISHYLYIYIYNYLKKSMTY